MKPRIYCLLSREAKLQPISGDRINEMNLLRALTAEFDVYYNGVKIERGDKEFGQSGKLHIPEKGEYDLIYIRANREVFLKSPHPKIWFASPYDEACFEEADAIACMTKPWQERLQNYSASDYLYFDESYPKDMVAPKACLLFQQAIELPTDAQLADIKNQTKKRSWLTMFKRAPKKLEITHFGPIRDSNYPHQLLCYISKNGDRLHDVSFTAIGPGKKRPLPAAIKTIGRIAKDQVPVRLLQSDAIWYNQHRSGNVAGSLKVLEAMAFGKLIISPKWDARIHELGSDYPLFWEASAKEPFAEQYDNFEKTMNLFLSMTADVKEAIGSNLRERANQFSIENSSRVVSAQIFDFLNQSNNS